MDNCLCLDIGGTGFKLTIPNCTRKIDQEELFERMDKPGLLKMLGLDEMFSPEDISMITLDVYEMFYGEDD